jgi:hypothetical protein
MKFTYTSGSMPLEGYTIKRGVGNGGFGEVYFATTTAGKEVALKRIQRNLDIELRGVAHCLNLKHPNLLQLFDIRQDSEGETWIVMEYISGQSLRDLIELNPGGLPRDQAEHWFANLAAAAGHLHANGIVHRDLKPANVFEDGGIVKLGDYGLSKFISSSRRGGHTESIGTFHYMAPEISRGEYGKEIDIYALGIILYEVLTGRVPFDGESGHEIVMKHLTSLPDLSIVPQPYRAVVGKALEKNPQARQCSVAEMLAPLGWSLDAQGLAVRRVSPVSGPLREPSQPLRPLHEPRQPNPPTKPNLTSNLTSPQPQPLLSAKPPGEEPILRSIKRSAGALHQWWNSLEHNPWTRLAIVALAIWAFFLHSVWLTPVLSMFVICYIPYFIIRQIVLVASPEPGPHLHAPQGFAPAQGFAQTQGLAQPAVPAAVPYAKVPKRQWLLAARKELAVKPYLLRSAELSGALAKATLCIAIAATVAALVLGLGRQDETTVTTYAPLVWSAMVALLGTWVTLCFGKAWEGREATGETMLRRIMLLGGGAALGTIAYGLADYLMLTDQTVTLANSLPSRDGWFSQMLRRSYSEDGHPFLGAFALHFAVVFGVLRWWRPSDPLRSSRLSLWNVAVAVLAGWLVQQLAPIPQPWGMITLGTMAMAVQFSAPWVSPAARIVG